MIGFFILEKIINILGEWRQERDTQKLRVVREGHKINDNVENVNVVCKNKYSNYCASEVSFLVNFVTSFIIHDRWSHWQITVKEQWRVEL